MRAVSIMMCLAALYGCEGKKSADATASPAPSQATTITATTAVATASTAAAMTSAEVAAIPAPEDFESAAEKTITKSNAAATLDSIEKDLK